MPDHIKIHDGGPNLFKYEGETFFLNKKGAGHCRNVEDENWDGFLYWEYQTTDESKFITLEQWDTNDFEAYMGYSIEEKHISNILPWEQS